MSRIPGRNTRPELQVRSRLHRAGFRFRVNQRLSSVTPDIVLRRYNTAIFVHGCFWHRHEGCPKATTPSSNVEFWQSKFAANVLRDIRQKASLKREGWNVVVLWECEVAGGRALNQCLGRLKRMRTVQDRR